VGEVFGERARERRLRTALEELEVVTGHEA
jgi:hypothetical protein